MFFKYPALTCAATGSDPLHLSLVMFFDQLAPMLRWWQFSGAVKIRQNINMQQLKIDCSRPLARKTSCCSTAHNQPAHTHTLSAHMVTFREEQWGQV